MAKGENKNKKGKVQKIRFSLVIVAKNTNISVTVNGDPFASSNVHHQRILFAIDVRKRNEMILDVLVDNSIVSRFSFNCPQNSSILYVPPIQNELTECLVTLLNINFKESDISKFSKVLVDYKLSYQRIKPRVKKDKKSKKKNIEDSKTIEEEKNIEDSKTIEEEKNIEDSKTIEEEKNIEDAILEALILFWKSSTDPKAFLFFSHSFDAFTLPTEYFELFFQSALNCAVKCEDFIGKLSKKKKANIDILIKKIVDVDNLYTVQPLLHLLAPPTKRNDFQTLRDTQKILQVPSEPYADNLKMNRFIEFITNESFSDNLSLLLEKDCFFLARLILSSEPDCIEERLKRLPLSLCFDELLMVLVPILEDLKKTSIDSGRGIFIGVFLALHQIIFSNSDPIKCKEISVKNIVTLTKNFQTICAFREFPPLPCDFALLPLPFISLQLLMVTIAKSNTTPLKWNKDMTELFDDIIGYLSAPEFTENVETDIETFNLFLSQFNYLNQLIAYVLGRFPDSLKYGNILKQKLPFQKVGTYALKLFEQHGLRVLFQCLESFDEVFSDPVYNILKTEILKSGNLFEIFKGCFEMPIAIRFLAKFADSLSLCRKNEWILFLELLNHEESVNVLKNPMIFKFIEKMHQEISKEISNIKSLQIHENYILNDRSDNLLKLCSFLDIESLSPPLPSQEKISEYISVAKAKISAIDFLFELKKFYNIVRPSKKMGFLSGRDEFSVLADVDLSSIIPSDNLLPHLATMWQCKKSKILCRMLSCTKGDLAEVLDSLPGRIAAILLKIQPSAPLSAIFDVFDGCYQSSVETELKIFLALVQEVVPTINIFAEDFSLDSLNIHVPVPENFHDLSHNIAHAIKFRAISPILSDLGTSLVILFPKAKMFALFEQLATVESTDCTLAVYCAATAGFEVRDLSRWLCESDFLKNEDEFSKFVGLTLNSLDKYRASIVADLRQARAIIVKFVSLDVPSISSIINALPENPDDAANWLHTSISSLNEFILMRTDVSQSSSTKAKTRFNAIMESGIIKIRIDAASFPSCENYSDVLSILFSRDKEMPWTDVKTLATFY